MSQDVIADCGDAEGALLERWARARRIALRACAETLRLLSAGAGGFYDAADLEQDLFLAFWDLQRRLPDEELWPAWNRLLVHGGIRLLQRAPQRLWARAEWPVAPEDLSGDGAPAAWSGLRRGQADLVQPEDGEAQLASLAAVDELEKGLWRLRPAQRQVVYLLTLRGVSAEEVSRRLGLSGGYAAKSRLQRARRRLRLFMGRRRAARRDTR